MGTSIKAKFLSFTVSLGLFAVLCAASFPRHAEAAATAADLVLGQMDFTHNGDNIVKGTGMSSPMQIAFDTTTHRVYVCDSGNNRVLWWDSISSLSDGRSADGVLGQPNLTTSGRDCSATSLRNPSGVVVDGAGNVWVADNGNNRVVRYEAPVSNGKAATLVLGQPGLTANEPSDPQTETNMNSPASLALDGAGNLWVADTFHCRVLRFDPPFRDGMTPSRVLGKPNLTSTDYECSQTSMNNPYAVAVDSAGNVWVVDKPYHRVLKYNAPITDGQAASLVLGQTDFTSSDRATTRTGLNNPIGVYVDGSGNVWVSDSGSNRILKYVAPSANGAQAAQVLGQTDFTSFGYSCTSGGLLSPDQLAVDGEGNLWVSDAGNNRVLKYTAPSADGQAASLVLGQADYTHKGVNMLSAQGLSYPKAVAEDASTGRVYACDNNNNRVLWWNSAAALNSGASADGVLGQPDFSSFYPSCTAAGLFYPVWVSVDGAGNVWVADNGNNRVLKFAAPVTIGKAAALVLGQPDFISSPSATSREGMDGPACVSVDSAGNVWVAEMWNNRVLKYTAPDGNGAPASVVLGQTDFTTGGYGSFGCSETRMSGPSAVFVDGSNNVWVSDSSNCRVLRFPAGAATGAAATLVLGQADFTAHAGGCSATSLDGPGAVSVDAAGNVWVSDTNNNRVIKFSAPVSSGAAASVVLGQPDFVSVDKGLTATGMSTPEGIHATNGGNVWVADSANNRILCFKTFQVNTCAPHTGENSGPVTITALTGRGFEAGAQVRLTRAGQNPVTATGVSVLDANTISCTFDLFRKAPGAWNVEVANPGGAPRAQLANAFTITGSSAATSGRVDPSADAVISLSGITVNIPAGTFSSAVDLTLTTATVSGLGQSTVRATTIGIEITNSLGLQPSRDITITLSYSDADIAGFEEGRLIIARYDNGRWIPIPSTVDAAANTVTGTVRHLSTFAIVQLVPARNLAAVNVYPNPYNPKNGQFIFDNLTADAEVKLYTVAGELVRTLNPSAAGRIAWDGKNDGGSIVASGVYIAFIRSSAGNRKIKIAVQR